MFGMLFLSIEYGTTQAMEQKIQKMEMTITTFLKHTRKHKPFQEKQKEQKNHSLLFFKKNI